jgi:hypothetical protein
VHLVLLWKRVLKVLPKYENIHFFCTVAEEQLKHRMACLCSKSKTAEPNIDKLLPQSWAIAKMLRRKS